MKDMLELVVNIIVNNIDVIMIAYLCYNLIGKKVALSIKGIFFGVASGTALGVAAQYLDSYVYKSLVLIFMMILFKIISQRKVRDLTIIYVIVYLCIIFVQIPTTLVLRILNINVYIVALLTQVISLIIIYFMCKKLPLYKLFFTIRKQILLQQFFFALVGIFLAAFFYFNFEYENIRPYVFYFSILIGISIICLYKTIKELFFYTKNMPAKYHDMKNIMLGLYISAHGNSDVNVIRTHLNNCLKRMDIDAKVEGIRIDEDGENILSFIQYKKYESNKKLTLITDVKYCEPNGKIDFPNIVYMLGVLLDNAIEASNLDKPIFVTVHVMKGLLNISVANPYKRKSDNDFEKMFEEGYSTKLSPSSGYGLPNLSKIVKSNGGNIFLSHDQYEEQKCTYLKLQIKIMN